MPLYIIGVRGGGYKYTLSVESKSSNFKYALQSLVLILRSFTLSFKSFLILYIKIHSTLIKWMCNSVVQLEYWR